MIDLRMPHASQFSALARRDRLNLARTRAGSVNTTGSHRCHRYRSLRAQQNPNLIYPGQDVGRCGLGCPGRRIARRLPRIALQRPARSGRHWPRGRSTHRVARLNCPTPAWPSRRSGQCAKTNSAKVARRRVDSVYARLVTVVSSRLKTRKTRSKACGMQSGAI